MTAYCRTVAMWQEAQKPNVDGLLQWNREWFKGNAKKGEF